LAAGYRASFADGWDSCRRSIRSASSGFAEFCSVLLGSAPGAAYVKITNPRGRRLLRTPGNDDMENTDGKDRF
jgi:hypothetical protein